MGGLRRYTVEIEVTTSLSEDELEQHVWAGVDEPQSTSVDEIRIIDNGIEVSE